MIGLTAAVPAWLGKLIEEFKFVFLEKDRYKQMLTGLSNTIKITLGALLIGIIIGILVAAVRSTYDKNKDKMRRHGGVGYAVLWLLTNIIEIFCLVGYFVIFVSMRNGVPVAIIAFGINSGAYVAEIFRGGIMSIDNGQFEAGRSLGFNYIQTMVYVVIPQMLKNALPTLCNEFIALLKETSVAGYVGVVDLTKAGNAIAGRTYSYFMPLFTVAIVYLVIVIILTKLIGMLERRLRNSEH